jgi:hypothetical protein
MSVKTKTPKVVSSTKSSAKKANRAAAISEVVEPVSKKPTKTKKSKTAHKKAAKPGAKNRRNTEVETEHLTDRYAGSGHPKGSKSSRTTEKRREVETFVAAGATLGEVKEKFKKGGLNRVARLVRYGFYGVKGASAQTPEERVEKTSSDFAKQLAKLPDSTKITVLSDPVQLVG